MAVSFEPDDARSIRPSPVSTAWKKRSSASSAFFRHAAQGLEERKQILYLLGPVGGGKSSLAERLKSLMEVHPIYVLKAGDELSPGVRKPAQPVRSGNAGADASRRSTAFRAAASPG